MQPIHFSRQHRALVIFQWLVAIVLIAASALSTSASAQINLKTSSSAAASAAVVQTPRVQAELVAQAPNGIAAGQTFWLGLKLAHEPNKMLFLRVPEDKTTVNDA